MKHLAITVALLTALSLPGCGARNIFTEPVDTPEAELAIGLLEDLGVEAGAYVAQEQPQAMPEAMLALEAAEAALQTEALTTEQLAILASHIPGTRGVRLLRIAVRLKMYADAKTGFLQPETIGYEAALAILRGFRLGVGV